MNLIRVPIAALLLAAAITQITWCVRFMRANIAAREDTAAAMREAIRLVPTNPDYHSRLASLDPDNRSHWLSVALALNPSSALLWIERGVNAEVAGDAVTAENSLLEAARHDHQYIPRWTLAAFYFRQHDAVKFRNWAKMALEMAWGDALPLFQMADQLDMSLDEIRRTMLPDRAPVLAAFIAECVRRKDFEETARTARRLIEIGTPDDSRTILYAVDSLFQAGSLQDAMDVWNRAVGARWIPNSAISANALITNPKFTLDFLPGGFDWKQPVIDGVVFWRLGSPRGLEIELSGREPESCTLLAVPLPVEPDHTYSIQTKVATSGIAEGSGLKWSLGAAEWDIQQEAMTFECPAKSEPLRLSLVYKRAVGTKRIEGTISIHEVSASVVSK